MKYKIIADSGSNVTTLADTDFASVPITIMAGGKEYIDVKLPTFEEIPDVGLYLEQTATFINKYLEPLLGSELNFSR